MTITSTVILLLYLLDLLTTLVKHKTSNHLSIPNINSASLIALSSYIFSQLAANIYILSRKLCGMPQLRKAKWRILQVLVAVASRKSPTVKTERTSLISEMWQECYPTQTFGWSTWEHVKNKASSRAHSWFRSPKPNTKAMTIRTHRQFGESNLQIILHTTNAPWFSTAYNYTATPKTGWKLPCAWSKTLWLWDNKARVDTHKILQDSFQVTQIICKEGRSLCNS